MLKQRFYNPAQLSDDDLKAMFIARQIELAALMRVLTNQPAVGPLQHILIIGARGMGKTTLGLRSLIDVRRTPALAEQWHPVPFFEESYGIVDLASLWLTALNHLSDAVGDPQWRRRGEALRTKEKDDDRLAAGALAALCDYRAVAGKRPILFIENLDIVFDQFRDKRQLAALRAVLQERSDFLILGTASSVFEAIVSHGEPFYEFFRQIRLYGLEPAEANAFLAQIAQRDGYRPLQTIIAHDPGRIEVIRSMTGGNPRLIAMAARLMAESPHGAARDDLERLIDEQTPYFKARIEVLPPQSRQVFHTLAEGWRPMQAREVAQQARLSSSHASAQIKYLMLRGYIEELPAKGRKKMYQITERFYNIYYVLRFSRDQKQRLERLIEFITGLFGRGALAPMADAAMGRVRGKSGGDDDWLTLRILATKLSDEPDAARAFFPNVLALCRECGVEDGEFRDSWLDSDDPEALTQNIDRLQQRWQENPQDFWSGTKLAEALVRMERYAEVEPIAERYYEYNPSSESASVYGISLAYNGRFQDAERLLIPWLKDDRTGFTHRSMMITLYSMKKTQEAQDLALKMLESEGFVHDVIRDVAIHFVRTGDISHADSAIDRFEAAGGPRHEALALRGRLHMRTKRLEDAERCWRQSIQERYDAGVFDDLIDCLADQSKWQDVVDQTRGTGHLQQTMVWRCVALMALGQWQESLACLRTLADQEEPIDSYREALIAMNLIGLARTGHVEETYDALTTTSLGARFEPIQHALARRLQRETETLPAEMENAVTLIDGLIDTPDANAFGALADLFPGPPNA